MPLIASHVACLRCPVCGGALVLEGRRVRCDAGHTSDLARQGYVHLSGLSVSHPGDTADMLDARKRVQASGLQDPVTQALRRAVGPTPSGLLVELGAGTGHHLAALLEDLPGAIGLALDSSRFACRRAAKVNDRVGAVVADTAQPLPLLDDVAEVVLSVFAPRPAAEMARVLRPGGRVVIAHALPGHLDPLVDRLGLLSVGQDKAAQIDASIGLALEGEEVVSHEMPASAEMIADLVLMGPNAFHQEAEGLRELIATVDPPIDVALRVRVATYSGSWRG